MPFLSNIGTKELIVIGVILLFLFGGKKLSEWARGLGETGKELNKVKKEFTSAMDDDSEDANKRKGGK